MRPALWAIFFLLTFWGVATARHARDSWKLKALDEAAVLTNRLGDAPLTADREQIYRIVAQDVGDDEDRNEIMNFRVGLVALAKDGSPANLSLGS